MRARQLTPLLAALCLVVSGCLFENAKRDGARCSDTGSCPPGQQCSSDGQCLYLCPPGSCRNSECGCGSIDRGDWNQSGSGWTCLDDGLCHFACPVGMGGGPCGGYMNCDSLVGVCRPACEGPDQCAGGAVCVPIPGESGLSGDLPPNFCVGDPASRDGGVKDGSESDGGVDGGGTWYWCGPSQVDLDNDQNHCGSCDHSCQGGACEGGQCQPYQLASTMGTGTPTLDVAALAIDGSDVYFAERNTSHIYRCSKSGCGTPMQLTLDPVGNVAGLAVDLGAYVYWSSWSDGKLHSCYKSGCGSSLTTFGSISSGALAVDGFAIYFATGGGVHRCDIPSCAGGMAQITPAASGTIWAIATDGTSIFWTDHGSGDDARVLECSTSGCVLPPAELAAGEDSPRAFAFSPDGSGLYWRTNSSIRRCSKFGCGGTPLTVTGLPYSDPSSPTDRLAVASHGIYWDYDGDLFRCGDDACSGGPQQLPPRNIAPHVVADEAAIYFADAYGVYRLAP